jgi:hypothetical protein
MPCNHTDHKFEDGHGALQPSHNVSGVFLCPGDDPEASALLATFATHNVLMKPT